MRAFGRERARERGALALAAGEVDAALADERVVALGERRPEAVDTGRSRGRERLVPVLVVAAGEQVLLERHGEENRPLRDERDVVSQLRDRQVARVDAADEYAPGRRVVEAGQEVEERRLARSRRPADRDDLARLDDEVEVVEDVHLAAVREADLLEADLERAVDAEDGAARRAPAAA